MDEIRHRNLHHTDVVLDDTNYLAWKLTMRLLLDGLRLWGHVDGTVIIPTSPVLHDSFSSSLDDSDAPPVSLAATPVSLAALENYEKRMEK